MEVIRCRTEIVTDSSGGISILGNRGNESRKEEEGFLGHKRKQGGAETREDIPTSVRIVPYLISDLQALMKLFESDTPQTD